MLINLGITLAAVVGLMVLCWRYSVSIRDVSFIDAIWAYGMVFAVAVAAILNGGPAGPAGWALIVLVGLWGLRLGTHLAKRLSAQGCEVLIADFKTGRPRLPAETPPTYLAQLALYRAALGPLYQGKQVRCFLVWTEGPVGHEVPAAMLDAALLDVQRARF